MYFGGHDAIYAKWIGQNHLAGPPALEFVDRIWLTYVARRSSGLQWLHTVAPIQMQTYLAQLLSNPGLIAPSDDVLVACREHAVTGDGMKLDHGDLLQTALEMVLSTGGA